MPTIYAECSSCGGTGLYSGFMERRGEAVVCVSCQGTGRQEIRYKQYTGRKPKRGITSIRFGSGLIVDDTRASRWFTYADFEEKIKAPKP